MGAVGVAVVPADEVRRGDAAAQVLALDAETSVGGGADGVDHRVVLAQEVGVREVGAHLDAEAVAEAGLRLDRPEEPRDLLGVLVVGGDTGPRETVRRRQPVVHGDADARVAEQLVGGEHPGRTRADHGHGQRAFGQGASTRHDVHGGTVGVRVAPVVARVQLQERQLARTELRVRLERVDRAGRRAGAAVHAGARVDIEHLGRAEAGFARCGVDAVDRTGQHTGGVGAAGAGDDVRHGGLFSVR